jgi:hypothetical protein
MKIEGFDDEQLAALVEIWNLGKPINVRAFLDRADIPAESKKRVEEAGRVDDVASHAEAYRRMQAQIVIEVAELDKKRWRP